jgi:hypothetical protein
MLGVGFDGWEGIPAAWRGKTRLSSYSLRRVLRISSAYLRAPAQQGFQLLPVRVLAGDLSEHHTCGLRLKPLYERVRKESRGMLAFAPAIEDWLVASRADESDELHRSHLWNERDPAQQGRV